MSQAELKQMKGRRPLKGGRSELVAHPVDEVFFDGQLVGQIARHENCTLCLYAKQNPEMAKEILLAVKEARAAGDANSKRWVPTDRVTMPPSDAEVDEAIDAIVAQEREEEGEEEGEESDSEE